MFANTFNDDVLTVEIEFDNGYIYKASSDATADDIEGVIQSVKFNCINNIDNVGVLGLVFSSSCDLSIIDESNILNTNNVNSPVKDYLKSNQKVRVYVDNSLYKTFRTNSFTSDNVFIVDETSTTTGVCSVGCFDLLKMIGSKQLEDKDIKQNVTLKNYIISILTAGGVNSNDIIVDESIDSDIRYTVGEFNSVERALNDICQSNMLSISVDKDEKVHVSINEFTADTSDYDISINQIIPPITSSYIDNDKSFDDIQLIYQENSLSSNIELIKEFDYLVKSGRNEIRGILLDIRCGGIDTVRVIPSDIILEMDNIDVEYTGTSDSMNLVINSNRQFNCHIAIYGKVLVIDTKTAIGSSDNRVMISNTLIQTPEQAEEFISKAHEYIEASKRKIILNTNVGFVMEVGDIVRLTNSDGTSGIDGLSSIDTLFKIIEINYSYEITYNAEVTLVRLN